MPGAVFFGRPLAHWLFGLRTWASMMLALYVAFWLQLNSASSAAITAAILALPTRGQVVSKALHRLFGTAVGVVASLAIAGLFNELRTPFLVAVAAWLGLCVYAANMLDGNRAYAAVLSGYTVAIVAVANIDNPGSVFSSGLDRGAAIAVGIAAVALVNDLSWAPDLLLPLLKRVEETRSEVRALARLTFGRGMPDPEEVARLFGHIVALRADAMQLPGESVAGRARAAAARRIIAELTGAVRAALVFGSVHVAIGGHGPDRHEHATTALDGDLGDDLATHAARAVADGDAGPSRPIAVRSAEAVVRHDRAIGVAMDELTSGRGPTHGPRLPVYHSRRNAARNALRTFLSVLAAGVVLVLTGLPSASGSLLFVCVLAGLSANSPDPRTFMVGALVAIPLAATAAGVTLFLLLDGTDAYPLLAMALLPTVLAGCLLMTAGSPKSFGIGFLVIVFTPALMSLANPQSYNPIVFLNQTAFIAVAALLLTIAVIVLLPTDDRRRRVWMLRDAQREACDALDGRCRGGLTIDEAAFRAADRIARFAALRGVGEGERGATLSHALHLAEVAFSARRTREAIGEAVDDAAERACAAMAASDATGLRAAADRLCAAEDGRPAGASAGRTAVLIERHAFDLALARAGGHP